MKLKKLNSLGQSLVNEEFLSNKEIIIENKPEYFDELSRDIDLSELENKINEAIEKYDAYDVRMDTFLAPILHKELKLTPREATDKEIWYYLTCYAFPQFVRHRWDLNNDRITKNRFLQGDFRKNTFYRLWLSAELTVIENDYSLTKKFLSQKQDFVQQVIERKCSWKKESLEAIHNVLCDKSRNTYRKTIKRLMQNLTVVVFEILDYNQIEKKLKNYLPPSEN